MFRLKPKTDAVNVQYVVRNSSVPAAIAAPGTAARGSVLTNGLRGSESATETTIMKARRTGLRIMLVSTIVSLTMLAWAGNVFAADCITAADDYAKQAAVVVKNQAAVKAAKSTTAKAKAKKTLSQSIAANNARKLSMEVACAALTGPQGAAGVQGAMGPIGATGAKGDAGDTGATGIKGDTGNTGAKGDTGDNGSKGDTGDTGANGDSGATGATGAQGMQGIQGEMGPRGLTGATGETGAAGTDGEDGVDGAVGATGATGATGTTGPSYSATAGNAANVTLTSKGVTPPVCVAGDATVATLTVPTSPGGISGTYRLSINAAGSIVTTSGTRTGSIAITVDGAIQGTKAFGTSTGTTSYSSLSTNTVVSSISAASSHEVKIVGCSSASTVNLVANTGTLSVTATN